MIIDSLVLKLLQFSPRIFLLYPELRLSEGTAAQVKKVTQRQKLKTTSGLLDSLSDPTTVQTADGTGSVYILTGTVDYFIASLTESIDNKSLSNNILVRFSS